MQTLIIIINIIALVFTGWFIDWALRHDKEKRLLVPGMLVLALIIIAALPFYGSTYSMILMTSILMYIILTVSWTLFLWPHRLYIPGYSGIFRGGHLYLCPSG